MDWRAPSTSGRTLEEIVWSWLTVFMDEGPRTRGERSLLQDVPMGSTFHGCSQNGPSGTRESGAE